MCKLTGVHGAFVNAHIIPKALAKPSVNGNYFIQTRRGVRPSRRWSSWYDDRLVTRAGEAILEGLDAWVIATLRKNLLIWSGWGKRVSVRELVDEVPGTYLGIRSLAGVDGLRLRLFLLSLLWRAAVSARQEFSEIALSGDDIEGLRMMIVTGNADPLCFYPAILTQLSTRGPSHNQTPIPDSKVIPATSQNLERTLQTYRFYFDGLIVHMLRPPSEAEPTLPLGPMIVRHGPGLLLSAVSYETSMAGRSDSRSGFYLG